MDVLREQLLKERQRFVYVLPNFQNPTGTSLSGSRRRRLVELCAEFEVPIEEDDPCGELRFSGDPQPRLASLAPDNVIYLSTFSKVLSPGIRLGWVAGPQKAMEKFNLAKQAANLHTNSLSQRAVYAFCTGNSPDDHVRTLRAAYRERRDAMVQALGRHLPRGSSWTVPDGGLFLWVTLPGGLCAEAVLARAVPRKVAFVPGSAFFTDGGGGDSFRMSFSTCDPARIEEGVRRLGALLSELPGSDGNEAVVGV